MQATSPLDPRVLDALLPCMTDLYGNPHSRTHNYGWETEKAVDKAREQVTCLIGADPKEIIFNLCIKGVARLYKNKKKHIITDQIEHNCVLDSCRVLQEGFEITYLPVQSSGIINMKNLESTIRPDTSLVSIMAINNEIGVIQSIEEIGQLCRSKKVFFHTDAAQAVGIGATYVRRRPRVRLETVQSGDGQESGLRSGTVPANCVGLGGEACRIANEDMERIFTLSKRLIEGIQSQVEQVIHIGDRTRTYPGCVNLSFSYLEGESLLMALKEIALSSGSAPFYVLCALGSDDEHAHSSIRFSIGRFTTDKEIEFVINRVIEHVYRLREMSPLWEMVQEGIDIRSI
ncbi:pyridoxal phosphate-dependent transferase [Pilaira anomala]|nr:pyridoxal phosphate-dependent transferase [Pilaira anomala]